MSERLSNPDAQRDLRLSTLNSTICIDNISRKIDDNIQNVRYLRNRPVLEDKVLVSTLDM